MDLKILLQKNYLIQSTHIHTTPNTSPVAQNTPSRCQQTLGYTKLSSECISRSSAALENILEFVVDTYYLDDILNILEEQLDVEINIVKKE